MSIEAVSTHIGSDGVDNVAAAAFCVLAGGRNGDCEVRVLIQQALDAALVSLFPARLGWTSSLDILVFCSFR